MSSLACQQNNKIDGDCFALVRAHQHGITIHNQDVMRERESGVISFIIYYYGGGEGGRTEVPLCSLSPLIAVDNLKLRIDCPPLNNE